MKYIIKASARLSFGYWSTKLSFSEECKGKERVETQIPTVLSVSGKTKPWFGGGSYSRAQAGKRGQGKHERVLLMDMGPDVDGSQDGG